MDIKLDIKACRVCLKQDPGISLIDDNNLKEKFLYTTQIQVEANDGMPNLMCNKCVARLRIAYEFRQQSIASEKHIRDFIVKVNSQFKEVSLSTNSIVLVEEEDMQILFDAGYKPEFPDDQEIDEILHVETPLETIDVLDSKDVISTHDDAQLKIEENFSGFMQGEDGNETFEEVFDEVDDEPLISEEQQGNDDRNESEYQHMTGDEEQFQEYRLLSDDSQEPSEGTIFPQQIIKIDNLTDSLDTIESRANICTRCNKDFSTKTNLMRHMLSHDGVKPFQCTICGNGFTQNGSLKQHMLIHTGERPYKCEVCWRGFTQAKSLTFHMRRHTGEKPFSCEYCGQNFRQRDGLKRHIHVKHRLGGTATLYPCSVCQKILHSKYAQNMHMKKHLERNEPQHVCNVCDKTFTTKASLESHSRQHTGEKPYTCDHCKKEFFYKSSLTSHMRRHCEIEGSLKFQGSEAESENEELPSITQKSQRTAKIFQCGKCEKGFFIKRNLLHHMRNHNRDYMSMHRCEECSIAFNTKRAWKLHKINYHNEAIPDLNECDICHVPFVSSADLNQHMDAVHDAIKEYCEICSQEFTSRKLMEDHQLEHELATTIST